MRGRHRRARPRPEPRGGYPSRGAPIAIADLPVVPAGPAPGARVPPPYDPDWTIVAWVRRP